MLLWAAPDAAARLDEVRALLAGCGLRSGRERLERPPGRARRAAREGRPALQTLLGLL